MIDGFCFKNAIISGANNITRNKELVDQLNIFPVPDGDTGTNMAMTINCATQIPGDLESESISYVADKVASKLLRGARGNSGVILSLIFRGLAKGLSNIESASGMQLVNALEIGVKAAYGAVMKPTEGTILTVARVACEKGEVAAHCNGDPVYVWSEICEGAQEALKTTPDLLPVLKKAGVVDAGGKGLCLIFEGMLSVFKDDEIIPLFSKEEKLASGSAAKSLFDIPENFDQDVNFTYCTEFITDKIVNLDGNVGDLRAYLETIGDCVLVVDDDEIVKVHVHTESPGLALQEALKIGQLLSVKIENMREQNRLIQEARAPKEESVPLTFNPVPPEREVGFVAVCAGEGVMALFRDLGCDQIVSGGQSMNPSTDAIREAILATPAKTVFILPNNKNIILAAEQTIALVNDRRVIIVPTKTIPQGISAMLAYDLNNQADENLKLMIDAASKIGSGQVTFASRDVDYIKVKKGDIIALRDAKLIFKSRDPVKAVVKLVNIMANKKTNFVTIIYGDQINEKQAAEVKKRVSEKIGAYADVSIINGGQPIYYFIISVD
ncbi:MAG: DAK2 domain-containing protein [Oscillospiraceae bacterium]|nr:DAK2 domain-containing protein [Oscillospiraceae bacterium]